jgi:amino acid transporter
MDTPADNGREKPLALSLLSSARPRSIGWKQAAGLLFGDWGTSRLYVLGLAFLFAGRSSFWLIVMMSLLILAVGWAYSNICRIYPDGGGVYSAAKRRNRTLAVIGALLLFADYTITASLSSLEAFHYFGLPVQQRAIVERAAAATTNPVVAVETGVKDAGDSIVLDHEESESVHHEALFMWDSPGLWAIVAIVVLGLINLLGPKHSAGFAIAAALGMILITLLIVVGSVPSIDWGQLHIGHLNHDFGSMWVAFVSIVLALSGVEAVANLTGVMKKPVSKTASKAVWVVAIEVAIFNVLLALVMLSIFPLERDTHKNDMLAYLAKVRVGDWAEWCVRIVGGVLLLSATNTAINGLMSVVYVVSRDGELPAFFQKTNRFGAPWIAAMLALGTPAFVLLLVHDLESLVALYAIGVVGAVAIDVSLCTIHPRLRKLKRKIPMGLLAIVLAAIWITLAFTKLHALVFVAIVMVVGLSARAITKYLQNRKGVRPSLLRQAIMEQITSEAMAKPKLLLGTYGSDLLAPAAIALAKERDATLVVAFVRQVTLSYQYDDGRRLTIDTDLAALKTFSKFLEMSHAQGVTVLPVYEAGADATVLLAETAALYGVEKVLIGTSRQGALYHLIKGHFQRRLEALLPPEVTVEVLAPESNKSKPEEPQLQTV